MSLHLKAFLALTVSLGSAHTSVGQKPMLFSLFSDLYPELQKGAEIVNLKIRDIDPVALKKIDEIAKRKGVSRQKFLKAQIEMLAFFSNKIKGKWN